MPGVVSERNSSIFYILLFNLNCDLYNGFLTRINNIRNKGSWAANVKCIDSSFRSFRLLF